MNMKMIRNCAARIGVVALCTAALSTVPMMAQGGGGGRMRMSPEARVAAIDKAVTLTDDQKTKITAIYTEDQKKMQDMMASGEDRSTMMPKMQAMRADENTKIKALLTDDQKPKFDAYLASLPQRGGGPGGGAPAGSPPPPPPQ
jgi:Spy/CpxP family protein refolding chaperone